MTAAFSTEFNVVALLFCKPYCFESEIPYCPPLKVPLLVFEEPLEHVLSGSNNPFSHSFGVICHHSHPTLPTTCAAQPTELATFYTLNPSASVTAHQTLLPLLHLPLATTVSLFLTTIPGRLSSALAHSLFSTFLFPHLDTYNTHAENVVTCLVRSVADWVPTTSPVRVVSLFANKAEAVEMNE